MIGLIVIVVFYPVDSSVLSQPPLMLAVFAATVALVIVVHYLLSSLTVEISARELSWYFGPGVWRKRIALSDIARIARVRLPWWYGIGIKYTPRAWVYLVAPGEGIEVVLAN